MYTSFNELPADARIWIYQANRALSAQDLTLANQVLRKFTDTWAAHGVPLLASFQFMYERFLIIGVDANYQQPSGCSIDASVAVVRELEQALDLSFLDRTQVLFKKGGQLVAYPMRDLKQLVQSGEITPDTLTFNNMLGEKGEWERSWEVMAKDSWMKRYF